MPSHSLITAGRARARCPPDLQHAHAIRRALDRRREPRVAGDRRDVLDRDRHGRVRALGRRLRERQARLANAPRVVVPAREQAAHRRIAAVPRFLGEPVEVAVHVLVRVVDVDRAQAGSRLDIPQHARELIGDLRRPRRRIVEHVGARVLSSHVHRVDRPPALLEPVGVDERAVAIRRQPRLVTARIRGRQRRDRARDVVPKHARRHAIAVERHRERVVDGVARVREVRRARMLAPLVVEPVGGRRHQRAAVPPQRQDRVDPFRVRPGGLDATVAAVVAGHRQQHGHHQPADVLEQHDRARITPRRVRPRRQPADPAAKIEDAHVRPAARRSPPPPPRASRRARARRRESPRPPARTRRAR